MAVYVGVDVGGTNLTAGLVDDQCRILARAGRKTPKDGTLCRAILDLAREVTAAAGARPEEVVRLGIGIPGAVDRARGVVLHTPNIRMENAPVADLIRAEWPVPVALENDAGCAAAGEYLAGAARGHRSAMVVTLGTGVGAGLIVDGALFLGCGGIGPEAGHMVIHPGGRPCNCGRKGCWERYASATGLKQTTREAMLRRPDSRMWELAGSPERVSGKTAFQAARRGDEAGREVVEDYLFHLGLGLANLVNCFHPEVICLGGGVSNEGDDLFLEPLRRMVDEESFNPTRDRTRLVKAVLGNDAGIIGAAVPLPRREEACPV